MWCCRLFLGGSDDNRFMNGLRQQERLRGGLSAFLIIYED